MSDSDETEDNPEQHRPHPADQYFNRMQDLRLGMVAGSPMQGARRLSYEQLPDDMEALKHLYLELQRTLVDNEVKNQQQVQNLRFFGGEDSLVEFLSQFWKRGLELVFIIGALAFIIPPFAGDIFNQTQITVGILTLTAFWERYLRKPVHKIGQGIERRWL